MTDLDDGADLRAVMERSVRDLTAPDRCGPAAMTSGRRIRTRRRVAGALTGVGAVAVVAALVVPALGGSGGTAQDAPVADTATESVPPSDNPSPGTPSEAVPVPPEDLSPPGWWDMPATEMVDALQQRLPSGVSLGSVDTTSDGWDGEIPAIGSLNGVLNGEAGPGSFQILLFAPDLDPEDVPPPMVTTDAAGNEHATVYAEAVHTLAERAKCQRYLQACQPITDEAGTTIGRIGTDVERGTTYYDVFLLGPDGGGLYFYAGNSSGEKPGYEDPSAEVPPLSLDQLQALAEDPVWTSYTP